MTHLGTVLRRARKLMGWSQRDLAARTGLRQSHIQRVERGEDVRLSTLEKLAAAFDADIVLVPGKIHGLVLHLAEDSWRAAGSESMGAALNPEDDSMLFTIENTAEEK